jgi:hypothetical protein
MSQKESKGLTALSPKIDYHQTAMSLPPVTSVVFLLNSVIFVNVGVSD